MKDGHLKAGRRALMADATGTAVGALLGTSTITSYVESAAGIHAGARTGLAAVVTGVMLLLTPFFYPLIKTVGAGVTVSPEVTLYPVTAPALIIVGVMMIKAATRIEWSRPGEAVPAFLAMTMMPLTISITEGIAFGLISYSALAVIGGRARQVSWWLHLCAALLLLRYLFLV
jgi:AGZA family xanthine/uracil permease-like MFS transporter